MGILSDATNVGADTINVELGRSSTATFDMAAASTGTYGTINTNSTTRPDGSTPHEWAEFRGYGHITPSAPSPSSPSNGATVSSPVNLQWGSVSNITSYGWRVYTNNGNPDGTIVTSGTTTNTNVNVSLSDGTYYWQVRGINATNIGGWSSVNRTFTVGDPS